VKENEIKALISLLDDPDENISSQISEKILSIGSDIIPQLESVWETSFDPLQQRRIENLIHQIQFNTICRSLTAWANSEEGNLLKGVLLIAKYQYPDLNEEKIKSHLDLIKQDTWLELSPRLTALEKIKVLNHIFFDIHGFSGNTSNYHAPANSYINNVLESKKGNPLSLSIIYCIVAQSLDIPIFGVNLPEHFIVCYQDIDNEIPENLINENKVYFYINPFSRGTIFGHNDIDAFLKQIKRTPEKQFYEPCSNVEMVIRLLNNLILSYEKLGYPDKIKELKTLQRSLLLGDSKL